MTEHPDGNDVPETGTKAPAANAPSDSNPALGSWALLFTFIYIVTVGIWATLAWKTHQSLTIFVVGCLSLLGVAIGGYIALHRDAIKVKKPTKNVLLIFGSLAAVVLLVGAWLATAPTQRPPGSGAVSTGGTSATSSVAAADPGGGCHEKPYPATDWGPDRPLDPPDQSMVPTFNNGLADGTDYRTGLVAARDAVNQDNPAPDGGYEKSIEVNEEHSYRVRFAFWNNANRRSGLDINDVRAFVRLPECPATDVRLVGTVQGNNAVPESIWGTVHFHGARPFTLELAPDGGPGHRPVVCWSTDTCDANSGAGFVPYDPNALVGPDGLAVPGGTLPAGASVFMLLYVRPVFA